MKVILFVSVPSIELLPPNPDLSLSLSLSLSPPSLSPSLSPFLSALLEFILEDLRERFDLASAWLFSEYSISEGYLRGSHSHHQYDNCLTGLLSGAKAKLEPKDRWVLLAWILPNHRTKAQIHWGNLYSVLNNRLDHPRAHTTHAASASVWDLHACMHVLHVCLNQAIFILPRTTDKTNHLIPLYMCAEY